MKKLFTILVASMLAFSAMAAETEVGLNDFKDFSHWSIAINGGFSQFDGDATQNHNQLLSESRLSWTLGINVEYTFNPYWGLIAQFQYLPYQGRAKADGMGVSDIVGNMYDPSLLVSINVFNLFGQYRKTWRWSMYLNAGVGLTFYNVTNTVVEAGDRTPAGVTDGRAINFPVYLHLEYNINKYLAVGLMAGYRFHNKDNFEGMAYTSGTYNDGAWSTEASFRVKLAPNKRHGHMRNLSMVEYRKLKVGETDLQNQLDSLEQRLAALEDTVYNSIAPKVDELTMVTPDEDGDGVPDIRDREPNTPQGAFVNYWGESIPQDQIGCCEEIKQMLENAGVSTDQVDYSKSVSFQFDKAGLTKETKEKVAAIAEELKADSTLNVEIRGYCDFPGTAEYNMKLSEKRVEAVKAELVKQGISEDRIKLTPKGALPEPPNYSAKNRRCDFIMYRE